MKYANTIEKDGMWYVMKGNKQYFPNTCSQTQEEAQEKGAILSAKFYLNQAEQALKKAEKTLSNDRNSNNYFNEIVANVETIKHVMQRCYEKHESYDPNEPCWGM